VRAAAVDRVVDALAVQIESRPWKTAFRRPRMRLPLQLVARMLPALAWHAMNDLRASVDDGSLVCEVADLVARYLVDERSAPQAT
jgi:hypothetical protein